MSRFGNDEKQLENVQILIIKAYFNEGKYEKSKQLLLNFLSNAKDGNLIDKIKKLSDKLEQIESLKEKANNYYKETKYTEAINVYNELLSLDNNNKIFNALILSNRSLCYYKMGNFFNIWIIREYIMEIQNLKDFLNMEPISNIQNYLDN